MPETFKERPILFSGPMVRAILAGTKTITRRVMKHQDFIEVDDGGGFIHAHKPTCQGLCDYDCHREWEFNPGDRLWVKETWRPSIDHHCAMNTCDCGDDITVRYEADGVERQFSAYRNEIPHEWTMPKAARKGNVTPLFMPRWASRLTLEVTNVRIERLHAITEEDAVREGFRQHSFRDGRGVESARLDFRRLWDVLNAQRGFSWESNPWLWVVTFKRLEVAHA